VKITEDLGLKHDTITFPRIRELKGKHHLTFEQMAEGMGVKTLGTAHRRFENGMYTFSEMIRLTKFFNALGENENLQTLFGEWVIPTT
jgi:transcriptional regulator with XRE-family HTH domain